MSITDGLGCKVDFAPRRTTVSAGSHRLPGPEVLFAGGLVQSVQSSHEVSFGFVVVSSPVRRRQPVR